MAAPLKLVSQTGRDREARDSDLLRLIDEEISTGITFENDEKQGAKNIKNRAGERDAMLDYYDGVMHDLPSEAGRSSAVSRDVADAVDTILPGLMRVFAGADRVVVYGPSKQGDEEGASQATDYINHMWQAECNGYLILYTWILDALQVRNGVVKAYWDHTPDYDFDTLTGLDQQQLVMLLDDPETELVGADTKQQIVRDPATGQSIPVETYDVRIRRVSSNGRLVVENVPPEDFGISRGAKSIETARAVWHRTYPTRSDLIKDGYDRATVDDLPAYARAERASEADRSEDDYISGTTAGETGATAEIEVIEAYVRFDMDDDGIAEMRKVVVAGGSGGRKILSNEEWSEEVPFADLTPKPVPHRWMGRCPADDLMDLARVKTALLRAFLDNTYGSNRPQRVVVDDAIVNADEVINPTFGGIIRIKKNYTAQGAIQDLTPPAVAGNALSAIQYMDTVIQRRTGISPATASLDSTALEPQTATAATIEHDASYARVELIARNMAELGLKRLFAKLLRIVVSNQDRPKTVRLRDKWVAFDPRDWNADMDVSINVGLGTGSRERDLTMLAGVRATQEQVIKELGADNPVVKPAMLVSTYHKMVEASGLKDPDQYFATVSDEEFAQWQAAKPPAPPDPKVQAIQAKAQADTQALQARSQGEQQKLEADIGLKQQANAAAMQNHRDKLEADLQTQREKLQAEVQMERDRMERDFAIRRQEMELEAELKLQAMASGLAGGQAQTNIPRY